MNAINRPSQRVRHETRMRLLQVVQVDELSPCMRRIVLGGEALAGFVSAAPDDHVKLFFPERGQDRPAVPVMGPNGPAYPEGVARPAARDYTPRRYDAEAGELTIDFVLHGDGPASNWASQAQPGQWIGVGGPRGSLVVSTEFDAYLLAGDETALPAISRWLEEMQPGTRAIVLIEVATAEEERLLPTAANASFVWLHRNGAAPGTGTLLLDALRASAFPAGDIHAWLAGEIETIRPMRAHLLSERGLPREAVRAAGYWRIGKADSHARLED